MGGILLVCSVICAIVVALLGFGVFSGAHIMGWLGLSIAFLAASGLVGYIPAVVARRE